MSRILIIGGHGKVALLLAPLLVARGDDVTSVIRNPSHAADVSATGATPVVADVETLRSSELARAVRRATTRGVVGGSGRREPCSARTRSIATPRSGRWMPRPPRACTRYVMVSYFGARADHGVAGRQLVLRVRRGEGRRRRAPACEAICRGPFSARVR